MTTRLHEEELLDHPFRNRLMDVIRREPGVAFLELYDTFRRMPEYALGLGHGSLSYHLNQLMRFGLITTRKSGRHRRHYENGGAWNGDTTALAVLQASSVRALCRAVLAEPGINQFALWQRVAVERPCTRQSISYHLHRLEEHGLLLAVRRGPGRSYVPTPKLHRLVPFTSLAAPITPALGAAA